jgi:hypothetical protein
MSVTPVTVVSMPFLRGIQRGAPGGVFASLRSALFLDGLSERDAIPPSALRLGFAGPGSSILRELHWSFMGAPGLMPPGGRGGRRRWGARRRGRPSRWEASNGTLCPQVGVHGGGSWRPTQWRDGESQPEPT